MDNEPYEFYDLVAPVKNCEVTYTDTQILSLFLYYKCKKNIFDISFVFEYVDYLFDNYEMKMNYINKLKNGEIKIYEDSKYINYIFNTYIYNDDECKMQMEYIKKLQNGEIKIYNKRKELYSFEMIRLIFQVYTERSPYLYTPYDHKIPLYDILQFKQIFNEYNKIFIENDDFYRDLNRDKIDISKFITDYVYPKLRIINEFYKSIERIIDMAPVCKKPFFVCKGVYSNYEETDSINFISTTYDIRMAIDFTIAKALLKNKNCDDVMTLMIINVRPGDKYILLNKELTNYEHQYEILIHPKYKIKEFKREIRDGIILVDENHSGKKCNNKKVTVVHCILEKFADDKYNINLIDKYNTKEIFLDKFDIDYSLDLAYQKVFDNITNVDK